MFPIKLHELKKTFENIEISYEDIVNYDIARESICAYIFLISRKLKKLEPTNEKKYLQEKLNALIYLRDELQVEDKENIRIVLKQIIPMYQQDREKND